ncbi:hypothetical protein OH77DRAFT_74144 [Trametes cingulata]|nr:hypothetical protein OH77DRAFT_74144 [Trametes cingulata]
MLRENTSDVDHQSPPVHRPVKLPSCSQCQQHFDTWHEAAVHRRSGHGELVPSGVTLRCPRCLELIPLGDVHLHCSAYETIACCNQSFNNAGQLAKHLGGNPVSCESSGIHISSPVTSQDRWKLSDAHVFCNMCNTDYDNTKAQAAHTIGCDLRTRSLAPGAAGVVRAGWSSFTVNEADSRSGKASEEALSTHGCDAEQLALRGPPASSEGFLNGLPGVYRHPNEASGRLHSFSTTSESTESGGHREQSSSNSADCNDDPDQPVPTIASPDRDEACSQRDQVRIEEYVSDTHLVEILAREYGRHSIERILSVLDDEERVETPKKARSLLSSSPPSVPAPAFASLHGTKPLACPRSTNVPER